jgi:nascent polypeptide-associated complex subunit beta
LEIFYLYYNLYLLVQASVPCSTFCISGQAEEKTLEQLLPGILTQLGPDSLANLRRLAESLKGNTSAGGSSTAAALDAEEEIPELIENFDTKVTV